MSERFRTWTAVGLAVALGLSVVAACGDRKDDGTAPQAAGELPPLTFDEETPNLMLTWIDERGATHVEVTPRDIPVDARSFVRVLIADRDEGTRDPIYVADLGGVRARYEAKALPRAQWEREIEKRRSVWLAEAAPPPAPENPSLPGPSPHGGPAVPPGPGASANPLPVGVAVVIYGADWCKPCHQAADFLKARGVPALMKDIDKSPEANAEMRQKLEKAGKRGGSIPVIDVGGQVLVGFDPRALERALSSVGGGTLL